MKLKFFILVILLLTYSAFAQETSGQKFSYHILTEQDDVVWGFDFIDADTIIFTERSGKLKTFNLKTKKVEAIAGAPKVRAQRQGGLLDVRVHPQDGNKIFLTYSKPVGDDESTTALGVGTLEKNQLKNFKELFAAHEPNDEGIHYGSRIEFDDKGHLFITVGDRNTRKQVQDLSYHIGSTIRLHLDGRTPSDNPFVKQKNAKPEIWSYGHRSPQGLVRDPKTGNLWLAEMGPRGGDELNLIQEGKNYGWPDVTYGSEYWGPKIGVTKKEGTVQPVAYWVPSISPSGMTIYRGSAFPNWDGNIFLANLSGQHLRRLVLKGTKVIHQEVLLKDKNLRFRSVRVGPDENLYLSTDAGHIIRLNPVK